MVLKEHFRDLVEKKMKSLLNKKSQEIEAIKEILNIIETDEELELFQVQNLLLLLEEVEVKGRQEVMLLANLIQMLNNELIKAQSKGEEKDD